MAISLARCLLSKFYELTGFCFRFSKTVVSYILGCADQHQMTQSGAWYWFEHLQILIKYYVQTACLGLKDSLHTMCKQITTDTVNSRYYN